MKDKLVDDVLMLRTGKKVLFYIRRRTAEGKFLSGSSPNAGQYSTKPFAMPMRAVNKTLSNKLRLSASSKRSKKYDPNNFQIFTSKTGNKWVIIKQGYKKLRELGGKPSANVDMNWSGRYLRDLGILRSEKDSAEIGWKSEENKKLGYFHEVAGAGKSKRLHKMLGLLDKEKKELLPFVEEEFIKKVEKHFKTQSYKST